MYDTNPDFDPQIALLTEACRLNPDFEARFMNAKTDAEVDVFVLEARRIVEEASEQAWV